MDIFNLRRWFGPAIVACSAILWLGACQKKPEETQAATGQEVARVGAEPITTSELQFELRSANNQAAPTDQDKAMALQRIAARKSLVQRAVAAGLDRQPALLLEMRKAREQILANAAVVSDLRSAEQKVTLEKINAFMSSHPFQFGNRQLLVVSEAIIPSKSDIDKIIAAVKTSTSLDQVIKYLNDNKIPFQQKQVELDTANLPDGLNQGLLQKDNIPFVKSPPLGIFMQVKLTKPAPVTGVEAEKAAKARMIRGLYETEMSAPSAGDDVTYLPPYKDMIDNMKAVTPNK